MLKMKQFETKNGIGKRMEYTQHLFTIHFKL